MKRMLSLPWLLVLLLLSCSGGLVSGPGAENGPAQGQAGGLPPIGTKPGPAMAQAAPGPGTEEVLLGPAAVDPTKEGDAWAPCEASCESSRDPRLTSLPENETRFQVKAKLQLKGPVGNRIIRIVEYFISEQVARFEDLKTDEQGNFSFVIAGPEKRIVTIYLPLLKDEDVPLNKMLPCPEDTCIETGAGNLVNLKAVGLLGEACPDLSNAYGINAEDYCSPLRVDLKKIPPSLVNLPTNSSQP